MTSPSKKDFVQLINQVTGNQEMTEQKLDRIMQNAKKSYEREGLPGFFAYMRKILQVPISDASMKQLLKQLQDPTYANRVFNQIKSISNKRKR